MRQINERTDAAESRLEVHQSGVLIMLSRDFFQCLLANYAAALSGVCVND